MLTPTAPTTGRWKRATAAARVIATSLGGSFTKQMTLPLIAPADGATLTTDPTFQWTRVVGAAYYRLKVSRDPSLSPLYDYVTADYISFTPYLGTPTAGIQDAYPNGTYYWEVEARDHGGIVIATSPARSFTKQMTLPLIAPADGATLTTDPTFQWTRVVGAAYYRLKVSRDPSLSPLYDYVTADYVSFTPYLGTPTAGIQDVYPNGTYYWEVEARDHGGIVIATSLARSFHQADESDADCSGRSGQVDHRPDLPVDPGGGGGLLPSQGQQGSQSQPAL